MRPILRFGTPSALPLRPAASPPAAPSALSPFRPFALLLLLFTLTLTLTTTPARAQYRGPGAGFELTPDREAELRKSSEEARWRLGPLHVDPWIGLRNTSYFRSENDQGETTEDLTATVGAGLFGYLSLGDDAILALHALPEYVWWRDQDELNRAIGRYGAGFFLFKNRFQYEVTARRVEDTQIVSTEVLNRAEITSTAVAAQAQLRLGAALAIAGGYDVADTDWAAEPPFSTGLVETLDQETTGGRLSARYLLRADQGHLGLGWFQEETNFDNTPLRDTESEGVFAELSLRGNKISADARVEQRELRPTDPVGLVEPLDTTTGRAALHLKIGWRLTGLASWQNTIQYSALDATGLYEETRTGLGLDVDLGSRSSLQLAFEIGSLDFATAGVPDDDLTAWGAVLTLQLVQSLNMNVGYRLTEIDSGGARPDRELEEILLGISLGQTRDW